MKTVLKTMGLLAAALASAPVSAQEYRVPNPWVSKVLQLKQNQFELQSVNNVGNLCHLDGRLQGQGSRRFYEDREGCRLEFVLTGNKVRVSIPEAHAEACRQYCGHNVWMDGDYERLPAVCSDRAEKRMETRFQAAYQTRRFQEAVRIKQTWLQRCEPFAPIVTLMRARNDVAVAYKNAGDKAACRRTLQPMRFEIDGRFDFEPPLLIAEAYQRELNAARFNWQACH